MSDSIPGTEADNPYRPPITAATTKPAIRYFSINTATILLLSTIICGLIAEAYEHETIVGSGPVLFLVGATLFVLALRLRQILTAVIGALSVLVCVLVVFLINYNGWGPVEGDAPITVIIWVYAFIVVPLSVWSLWMSTMAIRNTD